jgi:phenylacetate-CoA ligase
MEDLLYRYLKAYNKLPQPVRRIMGFLYGNLSNGIKYGSFYYNYRERCDFFNRLSSVETKYEQEKHLFKQVNYAVNHIPFYRNYGLCDSIEAFKRMPVISKKDIMQSYPKFVNPNHKNLRIKTNTGGSSGTPMEFYLEKDVSRSKEKSHFDWYWGQFNYQPGDKILMIRGMPLSKSRLFEYRAIDNMLNISCYRANKNNISLLINEINRFKPLFIHAYPSSLKVLTVLMDNPAISIDLNIKAVFLGSENLTEIDRQYFEQFYHAPVINWYGHTERLIHGGNCPFSNEFHFYPFYGYIELLDENNNPVEQPGIEARIVATGFDNRIMPFIRYDTGDMGILSEKTHCKCGFKGITLKRITGRAQHTIILADNTRVSLTAFIFGQHLDAFKRILEMQVIQKKIGEIELKIVKGFAYTSQDEESLLSTLLTSVDHKLNISINYVNDLPKTSRGKNIFFISLLNP